MAVFGLVPESRALGRPVLDQVGIIGSSAGLVRITFGLDKAGEHGWLSAAPLALILAGVGVLVAFFLWEGHTPCLRSPVPPALPRTPQDQSAPDGEEDAWLRHSLPLAFSIRKPGRSPTRRRATRPLCLPQTARSRPFD